MGINNFNRRQCLRALKKIGFRKSVKRRGKHDKFMPPENIKNTNPPFIMIPRHKNIYCQNEIVKEIEKMGGQRLVEKFRSYL
ncbi:hypothetical protein KAJ61_02010 [Candidatus Parcubacteria bacterium]|nr:hypothetical protein [Candidatus Parcubacteria bacterium]